MKKITLLILVALLSIPMNSHAGRTRIYWGSGPSLEHQYIDTAVDINQHVFTMNGFRFQGNHTKSGGISVTKPDGPFKRIEFSKSSITPSIWKSWYGVFAVYENGELRFKFSPFLRAAYREGNVIHLMDSSEGAILKHSEKKLLNQDITPYIRLEY